MTTDIARIDTNAAVALHNGNDALARLGQWVTAAQQAHTLVSPLVETPFVPDAYRPKVDPRATPEEKATARNIAVANATAAVLQGITLGLDPLTALQQIYVIHGRPGMYAEAMVALVKAAGHEVWTEDLSDSRAVVCGRRRGETHVERVIITMDQAKKAGWTSNQAYVKTPQDMLYARAAGRACKRTAPEVLLGIASVEEIQDTIQATAEVGPATRTVSPRRTRRALPPVQEMSAEEPPLDEEPAVAEPDKPAPVTGQTKKMYAMLRQSGREDKDTALVYIAGVVGRPVESTKDLSKAEVGQVIDALDAPEPAETEEPPLADWPATAEPGSGSTDG
jgi:hypothetical protein